MTYQKQKETNASGKDENLLSEEQAVPEQRSFRIPNSRMTVTPMTPPGKHITVSCGRCWSPRSPLQKPKLIGWQPGSQEERRIRCGDRWAAVSGLISHQCVFTRVPKASAETTLWAPVPIPAAVTYSSAEAVLSRLWLPMNLSIPFSRELYPAISLSPFLPVRYRESGLLSEDSGMG